MKSSTLPDGIPVLSRGRHRSPRRGACFMELASVLAGERWSDHPSCTHPLLAEVARRVNDRVNDAERQELLLLVPSVVGRRGDDRTWLTVAVAAAASVVLDVTEPTQRVLAGGLLQAESLCGDDPELAETKRQARAALELIPGAVAWVEALGVRSPITRKTFAKHSAPTMVRHAVEGVVATGSPDVDRRLRALLEAAIAATPTPAPTSPRTELPAAWRTAH
ncbi:MAG TPA: hypothetical protein VFY86_09195 [Nocardioides sp.]|nr:hypothetical protein [uncultured Nocardioides sp.]HEX5986682.1 hypothetical protein [Nocardioides sp.]